MAVLSYPSPGSISSGFGPRTGGGSTNHQGIDFSWAKNGVQNWNIYAAASGTIVFAGYSGGFGNLIIIDHGNGRRTYYAHQARFVRTSGWVNAGDIIGIIGNTGASNGAHLHFEYRINGTPVNPMPYFSGSGIVLRAGSKVTVEQAKQLQEWLGNNRVYDTRAYWLDIQTWAIGIGEYPASEHDGIFGPKTAAAELAVWDHYLKPPPPNPNGRTTVTPDGVNRRLAPNTKEAAVGLLKGGVTVIMTGFVRARPDDPSIQTVAGSGTWFVSGEFFYHDSGFTSKSVEGLPDLTETLFPVLPEPEIPVEPEPEEPEVPEIPDDGEEETPVPTPRPGGLAALWVLAGTVALGAVVWLLDFLVSLMS